jgi:type IV pilus assembly protein PilA
MGNRIVRVRELRSRSGFTMIEMMIVVAIVGTLAATAIPNYQRLQLRSKSSEAKVNLAAIRTAEESYFSEFGQFVSAAAYPTAWAPGPTAAHKLGWVEDPLGGFAAIGWQPEGDVFFQYHVEDPGGNGSEYVAEAQSDLDGNGAADPTKVNTWGYVQPELGAPAATANGTWGCSSTGVFHGDTGLEVVGPCCIDCGKSVF